MDERELCPLVHDVLPSYVDNLVSAETRAIVERHTAQCPACAAALEAMGGRGAENAAAAEKAAGEKKKLSYLKAVRRKLALKIAAAALALCAALGGLWYYAAVAPCVLPAEAVRVEGVYSVGEGRAVCALLSLDGPGTSLLPSLTYSRLPTAVSGGAAAALEQGGRGKTCAAGPVSLDFDARTTRLALWQAARQGLGGRQYLYVLARLDIGAPVQRVAYTGTPARPLVLWQKGDVLEEGPAWAQALYEGQDGADWESALSVSPLPPWPPEEG